ncbi:MAG: SDR family oxidoreductase [Ignavibacteria bacterium]|nr:SDR family oxidoreductase [Ignavibacteria bacterium]MCU7503109.1 SDR family oxidoreductase [Ignavibacteria bacterium]MCU7516471.1 SDR family oxidoreductase [Ignavibacteria bacterium]
MILGASSGFGGATAVELAKQGYNIIGIHLDRQVTMPNVQQIIKKIEKTGQRAVYFNINGADPIKREEVLDELLERASETKEKVRVLVHSMAFGTLRPYFAKNPEQAVTQASMTMTLDVMAHSLVYWTQGLVERNLLAEGGRIFALTSAGSETVIPCYGAVSAAKAALEAHIRQIAVELGFMKVTANAIMAGVTDTPALKKIPGSDKMLEAAQLKNPMGKLTIPEEIAHAIALLCQENAGWISGNTIRVDGGEYVVNYMGDKVCKPF